MTEFDKEWGVTALLEAKADDPAQTREALRGFYQEVSSAAPEAKTGRFVAHLLAGSLLKDGARLATQPMIEDTVRLERVCSALVKVGAALDAFEAEAPAYHNRAHGLSVGATMAMRNRAKGRPTTAREAHLAALTVLAAFAHDLGHNGTSNTVDGVYTPAALEMKSFAYLEPLLDEAKVQEEDKRFVRHMLYGTDPGLPGEIALYAYRRHFGGDTLSFGREALRAKIDVLPEAQRQEATTFMAAVEENRDLASAVMTLKGCDMVPSFGLSEALWIDQCQRLQKEVPAPILDEAGRPVAKGQLFVMFNFVGAALANRAKGGEPELAARFVDPVLQRLFGQNLAKIQACCAAQAGPEAVQGQTRFVAGKYGMAAAPQ